MPNSLPAINKAQRIQDKVRAVGFDWDNKDQVMDKIMEEIGELKEAIEQQDEKSTELEFGDVLFAMINYSRFIKVDAEQALEKPTRNL